jgi:hypothetical protein
LPIVLITAVIVGSEEEIALPMPIQQAPRKIHKVNKKAIDHGQLEFETPKTT